MRTESHNIQLPEKFRATAIRHTFLFIVLFMLFQPYVQADNPSNESENALFKTAHQAYLDGDFETAQEIYQHLIDRGVLSADIYYNLGNSYFRQQKIAKAILNYERALKLRPGDQGILFNLQLANTFIRDDIQHEKPFLLLYGWKLTASLLPPVAWLAIHLALFLCGLFLVARFLTSNASRTRVNTFRLAILSLSLSLLIMALSFQSHHNIFGKSEAIILADTATIKSGPGKQSNTLGHYHAGTKVRIINHEEGWLEVKSADGHIGWIDEEKLEII